jgi:hypothetical protein
MNRPLKTFTGSPLSRSGYKGQKSTFAMGEVIVDEETFLASFGERQYQIAKKYLAACELNKHVKNFSEIARQTDYPKTTVAYWLTGKTIPIAIKALNSLKSLNLMPLIESNNKEFVLFTESAAFLFGDGHLMRHLGACTLFGQKADLEDIALKISKIYGLKPKVNFFHTDSTITKISNGKITKTRSAGSCWRLNLNCSPLARLFYLAGVPVGDKVSISTRMPIWVMNGGKETKRAFLSVLFGNELQCPFIRAKNAFTCAQLAFHKIESKKEDLKIFLKQIKILLTEFGISTSRIAAEKCRTIRKDGNRSMKVYFSIDSHGPNILRLFNEIPFKYDKGKQGRFAKSVKTFLQNSQNLKYEWHLYEKVMKMHENGLGRRTIFKKLQLPQKYFYKINAWIHYGYKPLYYNEKLLFV